VHVRQVLAGQQQTFVQVVLGQHTSKAGLMPAAVAAGVVSQRHRRAVRQRPLVECATSAAAAAAGSQPAGAAVGWRKQQVVYSLNRRVAWWFVQAVVKSILFKCCVCCVSCQVVCICHASAAV
jgi:hypothetical protein